MNRFGFFKISSENDVQQVIWEELQGYFFSLPQKRAYCRQHKNAYVDKSRSPCSDDY